MECPVCGGFMLGHQQFCTDCEKQKRQMEEMRRQRARDHAFGSIWDTPKRWPRREDFCFWR